MTTKKRIICGCGKEMREHDKITKRVGFQFTEDWVGQYIFYKCECGNTYWEFVPR